MSATTGLSVRFYALEETPLIWATYGSCGIMIAFYPQVKRKTVLDLTVLLLNMAVLFPARRLIGVRAI